MDVIMQAVRQLTLDKMRAFGERFAELQSELQHEQIERDAKNG